jgi:hypothetical protein
VPVDPVGHVRHPSLFQYSVVAQVVHDVVVALPPALNEPNGHTWQADPSQYSLASHAHKVPSPVPVDPVGHVRHPSLFQYSVVAQVVHDVVVALPPALNEPSVHAAHDVPSQYSLASHIHMTYFKLVEPAGHVTQADPSAYSSAAQHTVVTPPGLVVTPGQHLHAAPSQYSSTAHHLLYGLQSKSATLKTSPSGMYFHASNSPALFNLSPSFVRSITYPSYLFSSDVIAAVVSTTFPSASLKSTFMF